MMSFENKPTDALIRIAKAGLGFTLVANSKTAEDIHQLANAAAESGAKITFIYKPEPDLSAGQSAQ
ncbi:MAG TPA: hypothetical protein VK958_08130 [Methylophilus sp.]|uniref:hypothetical protein n=1 Tax=Methylophilus sp. TaxID=29541 RepID=UPI002B948BBC|nr:hypothetical protein [Methylophilus sp.]HSH87198.1 hypothetical protein [Methylophilus sp.]